MRSLLRDLLDGLRHPQFWAFSGWLDIVAKYRMSRLGVLWMLLPSTLYIWGVGSFFALLQGHSLRMFIAYIAVGVMVFRFMTSVITESTTAFVGARAFIMDGHMRLADFVLRVIAKALFFFLMSIPAAAIALYVYPELHWTGMLMGVAAFPLVMLNMLWVGVMFSLIGARHPDLSQFIGNIFMFLFLLTPIIWSAEQMPPGSLRSNLVIFNPFYYLIEIVRAPILTGHFNVHALVVCAITAVVGLLVAMVAYRRWSRWVPIWI